MYMYCVLCCMALREDKPAASTTRDNKAQRTKASGSDFQENRPF